MGTGDTRAGVAPVSTTAACTVGQSVRPLAAVTLADGETVQVTAEHDDFVLIETAAGRTGWVARANLARVVP